MRDDGSNGRILELLSSAKALAAEYYQLTGKPLGVTGEVAELLAAQHLALSLAPARTKGYDAVRGDADKPEKIQIKGRAIDPAKRSSPRMGTIKRDADCDTVMLVVLDIATLDLVEIWEATMVDVLWLLDETPSKARKRGSLAISTFKRKARRVWSSDEAQTGSIA